ncbi:antiterminator LoaP [Lachnospiraceae bacterium 62-26]
MWYVMQVTPGQESRTVYLVEEIISKGTLKSCFVPVRKLRKKFHGAWREVTEKLFPGYVFMISEQPQLLYEELKQIPSLTKMLGRCEEYFTPLSDADVHMMEKLQNGTDDGNMEVEISKAVVEEGNRIRILSGPLVNLEGQIRKVNLHKRIAEVRMEFMGSQSVVYLGVEMVERVEKK